MRVAACAWILDIILLTPRCWVRAGTCYSAAVLLLPCSFNGVEGVQGPPASSSSSALSSSASSSSSPSSPSPSSPLLCCSLLSLSLLSLSLLSLSLLSYSMPQHRHLELSPLLLANNKNNALSPVACSTARLCRRVEAHRSTVVNLGGVWDLSAENKRPARQNGDEEKDVPDKRYALSSVAARNTYNHGSLSPRTSPRDAGICSPPGM